MTHLLLAIIYISFISLGLPDSLLGSAWPILYKDLQVPVSYAGILSMIIAAGTIVSSLFSSRLIWHLGTGKITAIEGQGANKRARIRRKKLIACLKILICLI